MKFSNIFQGGWICKAHYWFWPCWMDDDGISTQNSVSCRRLASSLFRVCARKWGAQIHMILWTLLQDSSKHLHSISQQAVLSSWASLSSVLCMYTLCAVFRMKIVPHKLWHFNAWSLISDTICRDLGGSSLAGGNISLGDWDPPAIPSALSLVHAYNLSSCFSCHVWCLLPCVTTLETRSL